MGPTSADLSNNTRDMNTQDTDPRVGAEHMPMSTNSLQFWVDEYKRRLQMKDTRRKPDNLAESQESKPETEKKDSQKKNPRKKNREHSVGENEPAWKEEENPHEEKEWLADDHIADRIQYEINKFTVQSFEKYQDYHNKLHVYPVRKKNAPALVNGKWVGYLRYTFDMYGQRTWDRCVFVDWQQATIWVGRLGRWINLQEFLSKLPRPVKIWDQPKEHLSLRDKTGLWQDQWTWWQKNGEKFRLLDLPSEIRENILAFAVVRQIHPNPRAEVRRLLPPDKEKLAAENPNMKLLRTSKQIYSEANHLLFRDSVFRIEHFRILELNILGKKAARNRINRLDLHLDHRSFFRLFGIHIEYPKIKYLPDQTVTLLRDMKLTQLTLTIAKPGKCFPSAFERLQWPEYCQKVATDWVMECAWPWVKRHPVNLQGAVENRQKQEFEEKLADQHERYLEWRRTLLFEGEEGTLAKFYEWEDEEGGVRVDGQEPTGVPKKQNLPPCQCMPPCHEKWPSDD